MRKICLILCCFFLTLIISNHSYTQTLVMNEIYSRGTAGNLDWIEIYNTTNNAIDMTNYKIYDIGGQSGSKPKKKFPDGTIIQAKGFYVIITDTADFLGDQSGFGLSSNGETVWLEDPNGIIIDSITFPPMATTQTYGRYPDGGDWQLLNTITRGYSNVTTSVMENNPITHYSLFQNYPNPFNPSTTIKFTIPEKSFVNLSVFNLLGIKVDELINRELNAGQYEIKWNAETKPAGLYFYKLQSGTFNSIKKMILIK